MLHHAIAAVVLTHIFSVCLSGWIDPDTLSEVNTTRSLVNGRSFSLVFSDEFDTDNRVFKDGVDPRWTSINKNDYTNYALHYFSDDMVKTSNGFLNISTIVKDNTYTVNEIGVSRKETKNYESGMVQGWNKFCFTGGIVEISAKLPGRYDVGGLWPAMWMLGNLARATYVGSSDNVWPWSYDTCSTTELQHQQLISACNRVNHFDLHPHQGRGAPEVDILEGMPGKEVLVNTPINKPYYSLSYQVSPGYEGFRPDNAAPAPAPGLWYHHDIEYGENTSLNIFFYGMRLAGALKREDYLADALSANRNLSESHFTDFHTYRLEWESGKEGYLRWYLDDQFVYGIGANALNITGAIIPEEPMYLIFNTGISATWGFPTPCPEGCLCDCFDCRLPECACGVPYVFPPHSNEDQKVGCSTPSHPTKKYIQAHAGLYKTDEAEVPLLPIRHGGGACITNTDCGVPGAGSCTRKKCVCTSDLYTGPHCRAPKGFDDIIWDRDTEWRIYNLFLPSGLLALIICVAVLFIGLWCVHYAEAKSVAGKWSFWGRTTNEGSLTSNATNAYARLDDERETENGFVEMTTGSDGGGGYREGVVSESSYYQQRQQ